MFAWAWEEYEDCQTGSSEFFRMMEIPGPGKIPHAVGQLCLGCGNDYMSAHTVSQMHQVIHLKWVHLKKLCLYIFGCAGSLYGLYGLSPSCCEQGLLSSCRTQPSIAVATLVAEQRL